jgi:uncharacterized membrane protein
MTETPNPNRPWTRLRPRASLLLLGSLFLNVLLGSYVAVQTLIAEPRRPGPGGPQQMLAKLAERLPPSDAEIVREAYLAREPEILAAEMASRRAMTRAKEIVGRPELDMDALRVAAKDIAEQRTRLRELVFGIMIETMQHISPEARMKLAREDIHRR